MCIYSILETWDKRVTSESDKEGGEAFDDERMEHVTSKLRMKRGGGGRERESEEKLYDRDSARLS